MSDTNDIYQPGEGDEPPAPAPDNQPDLVTKEYLEEKLRDIWKGINSFTAKQENRIAKKLSEWEKRVTEAGIPVTAEMKTSAQQRIAMDMLNDESLAQDGSPAAQASPGNPLIQKVVEETAKAKLALEKKYDYVLTENDPEFYEEPWKAPTPDEFLKAYEQKLREAAPRRGRQLPVEEQPGTPGARIPVPLGGAATADLYQKYQKEVQAASTQNERLNIRVKYRSLGLEI